MRMKEADGGGSSADCRAQSRLLAVVVDFGRITAENLFHLAPRMSWLAHYRQICYLKCGRFIKSNTPYPALDHLDAGHSSALISRYRLAVAAESLSSLPSRCRNAGFQNQLMEDGVYLLAPLLPLIALPKFQIALKGCQQHWPG